MADDLSKIFSFIGNIFEMFVNIGKAFGEIFEGTELTVEKTAVGLWHGGLDLAEFTQYIAVFLFTNLICFMKGMTNMTSCIFYYLWDVFLQLCYLPVRITLFLLSYILPSVYDWEKQFWDFMERIDQFWVKYFRFHLIHYPKVVRDKCYNCKRLKTTVFAKKMVGYADDAETIIYDIIVGPEKIFTGFMDTLKAVINVF